MTFNEVTYHLMNMPVARLEYLYNDLSRKHHNGINTDAYKTIMNAIEVICGLRGIKITGGTGSYEMRQNNDC